MEQTSSPALVGHCPDGHEWVLVRRYIGLEDFNVEAFVDMTSGQVIDPDELEPVEPLAITVVASSEVNNDVYEQVVEERVECRFCPATIDSEQIFEVEYLEDGIEERDSWIT